MEQLNIEVFVIKKYGSPNLYRTAPDRRYYGLVERGGKQFRRSLKISGHALARQRLREFQEKASRLSGDLEPEQCILRTGGTTAGVTKTGTQGKLLYPARHEHQLPRTLGLLRLRTRGVSAMFTP